MLASYSKPEYFHNQRKQCILLLKNTVCSEKKKVHTLISVSDFTTVRTQCESAS